MTGTNASPDPYRLTIKACYLGMFILAIVVNLSPILFLPLSQQFGLTFSQMGTMVLVNFMTQICAALICSGFVDKYGFRPFAVATNVLVVTGFGLFAAVPLLPSGHFAGFLIATVIFSGAGGLLEMMVSPILNAIPSKNRNAMAMSVLHSFYCWGQALVALLTTLFLFVFGRHNWWVITLIWCLPALVNLFLFARVPLPSPTPAEKRTWSRALFKSPIFIAALALLFFSGATEISISQWISTFMEAGLNLPKITGDILGMCGFAVMMAIGRFSHSLRGEKIDLYKLMLGGAALSFACYLMVVFSPWPWLSLLACVLSGLGCALLWPGGLSLAAKNFPMAGTFMFAVLGVSGDMGASLGPWSVGFLSDRLINIQWIGDLGAGLGLSSAQIGLRSGLLIAAVFPLGAFIMLAFMRKKEREGPTG